jgi:hypothetical protein
MPTTRPEPYVELEPEGHGSGDESRPISYRYSKDLVTFSIGGYIYTEIYDTHIYINLCICIHICICV